MSESKRSPQEEIDHIHSFYEHSRFIDTILVVVMFVIYTVVIFLIIRRRNLQPIKMKGFKLISISILGSGLIIESLLTMKILESYV
jgi:ascorbate-specific PTS system EIIC-type component UlaA